MNTVIIYTDGACEPNPGIGGWGAVLEFKGIKKEIYGGELNTTNNRMELLAAIMALELLNRPCVVIIYTDSQYVKNGITDWIHRWVKKDWKRGKKEIKNIDLWKRLYTVNSIHQVEWKWVKGHTGVPGNEHADVLASKGRKQVCKSGR